VQGLCGSRYAAPSLLNLFERVWSLNFQRRDLNSSQRAACDALRNKLLNSYAVVREAAKERQMEGKGPDGSGGRGKKKNLPLQNRGRFRNTERDT